MTTPKEFEERMKRIEEEYGTFNNDGFGNEEDFHIEADILICRTLQELGYENGVEIFERNKKWYS